METNKNYGFISQRNIASLSGKTIKWSCWKDEGIAYIASVDINEKYPLNVIWKDGARGLQYTRLADYGLKEEKGAYRIVPRSHNKVYNLGDDFREVFFRIVENVIAKTFRDHMEFYLEGRGCYKGRFFVDMSYIRKIQDTSYDIAVDIIHEIEFVFELNGAEWNRAEVLNTITSHIMHTR